MNKKKTLTILVMFVSSLSFSQIKITDQYGNIKIVQSGNEPWRVQGTTDAATANDQNIYQNGNVAIGDFSASTSTEKLDVDGNMRVRTMPVGTNRSSKAYSNNVVAKSDGTLGYVPYNVTQVLSNGSTLNANTTFALIMSRSVRNIKFPTTEAEGAYDGRIVVLRNDGAANINVEFNDFAGQPIKYASMSQSAADIDAYSYDRIPSRSIITLMYSGEHSKWIVLTAMTSFTGSNR